MIRRFALLMLLALVGGFFDIANAQQNPQQGHGAPTGVCAVPYMDIDTGNLYTCKLGTYVLSSGSGSGGTVTYTASQTASSADNGKLVLLNCSSACQYTLPNPVPSSTWFACPKSIGSTNATLVWATGTTVEGVAFSSIVGGTPTLGNGSYVNPCFYADSTTNTKYHLRGGTGANVNVGKQLSGGADITITSTPVLLYNTAGALIVPWDSAVNEGDPFSHDMCAAYTLEVNYTGATAGTLTLTESFWGNNQASHAFTHTIAIPASLGTQTFSFSGDCVFKSDFAPGISSDLTVYGSTSLTGLVAKFHDANDTTVVAGMLNSTIE